MKLILSLAVFFLGFASAAEEKWIVVTTKAGSTAEVKVADIAMHLLDAIEEGERRAQAQSMTTSFT